MYFAWICEASEAREAKKRKKGIEKVEMLSRRVATDDFFETHLGCWTGILVPREIHTVDDGHDAIERETLGRELADLNRQRGGECRTA